MIYVATFLMSIYILINLILDILMDKNIKELLLIQDEQIKILNKRIEKLEKEKEQNKWLNLKEQ